MIFLNAPFLFSWENEHDFLKSAFLIFASNVQCRFLPQSLLFSRHSQYHAVYVLIYAPMTSMNHDATRGLAGAR